MKVINLVFLTMLLAGTASPQTSSNSKPSEGSTVTVIEMSWRQEVFIPALYDDPMRANQDRDDLERDRKATAVENATRAKQGQTALPDPTQKIASNTPVGSTPMGVPIGDEPAGNRNLPAKTDPGLSSVHYLYKAKIKNTGEKDIRGIRWQYLLLDRTSGLVIGRHSFTTPINLRSGRTIDLIGRSRTGPASVVDARSSDKESRGKYAERVIIESIEYADGSNWRTAP
jgi:hypothetical protein